MEQVLGSVLVMIGAGLLMLLAVPVGLVAVSGVYYARRTAVWLVPMARRYAMDLGERAADLGWRVVHSRVRQTLVAGAVGCTLALPSVVVPVRDLDPGFGAVPLSETIGGPATPVGSCCGAEVTKPAEPAGNQVIDEPVVTGDGSGRQTTVPADECVGSCDRSGQQKSHPSKSETRSKKKKKAKG